MYAFSPEHWSDFFVAEIGATAALAGLLTVAISINLKAIVEGRLLSGRAAETILMLGGVLVLSTLALVPGQTVVALGYEELGLGVIIGCFQTVILLRARRFYHEQERRWMRVAFGVSFIFPLLLSGLSLATAGFVPGGLYWLVPSVVIGVVGGLINSWVLLVEILR